MLKDAKIATKVIVGFTLALVIAIGIGLVGRQALQKNSALTNSIATVRMPSLMGVQMMAEGQNLVAAGQRGLIVRRMMDAKTRQENYDTVKRGLEKVAEGRRIYEPLPQSPEEAKTWRRLVPVLDTWKQQVEKLVSISKERDSLSAQGLKTDDAQVAQVDARALETILESRDARVEAAKLIEEIIQINTELSANETKEAALTTANSSAWILGSLVVGALALISAAFVVIRGVSHALRSLNQEAQRLAEAAVGGQLSTRGDVTRVPVEFRSIVQGVNDTLDAVIGPLNVAAQYVDSISRGAIPTKITDKYNGDFNTIKNNLNQCIDAVNQLVVDAQVLSHAAVEGKLATRADASKHQGDFRKIVQGVNDTLDAVIDPLNVAAQYVDSISRGAIPQKITDKYNGDFNTIKNNLNQCIDAVNLLVADSQLLSRAAVEGKLATRADASKHQGDFRRVVQGVNDTLDAVIGPLNVAARYVDSISRGAIPAKITDAYNGDFNTIKNNLNQCIDAVNQLIADAQALSDAAIAGRLSTRADASKHTGDFRRIVEGVNKTLDSVIDPVMEATQVLEGLAQYDLRVRVTGNYSGDHARIKEALNGTAKALHDALSQVADAVEQVSEASKQIAVSSQSVAQGASEQASSLEETSSSLEEMASMTKQNADNTVQARTLAQTTKVAAEKGGKAMERMIDAMEKIRAASEGTSQIIKDINDIAFQTNLLALNAAVEAARAGDAGRGFAVVAEEVRNLALRSKEAAKKTEDLIRMSVGHAENGRVISGEVAGSLTEIVSAAGKVNDIVSEIAVASQEQSRGIEQVNTAVSEMDKVVQVAAANAEESSSAAEELSSQSEELTGMVTRFQLSRDQQRRPVKREASAQESRRRTATSTPAVRRPGTLPTVRGRNAVGPASTRKPSPEEVIPFEDPEFNDF